MADYPVLFKVSYDLSCRSFAARVVVSGRALMVYEDDEWWCHGVEPGGMTAHGRGPAMAYAAFKATLGEVLKDVADDAGNFEDFEKAATHFASESDPTEAVRWEAARQAIRSGQEIDWPFAEMRHETGEWPVKATVEKLDRVAAGVEDLALAAGDEAA